MWNSFLNETEKSHYRSISLNIESKKRYLNLFEFEEELSFCKR